MTEPGLTLDLCAQGILNRSDPHRQFENGPEFKAAVEMNSDWSRHAHHTTIHIPQP